MPSPDGLLDPSQIRPGSIVDRHIGAMSVGKLVAGSIEASQYVGSPDFVSGQSGWRISGDGSAEFNDVTVRGTIYASSGELGDMLVTGELTTGGAGEPGIRIAGTTQAEWLVLYTGNSNETDGAGLHSSTGEAGGSEFLYTALSSPSISDNMGDTYLRLETETADDSSKPPTVSIDYSGESTQGLVFHTGLTGLLSSKKTYDWTTGNAANVVVAAGSGNPWAYYFQRSTSSLAYKDVEGPVQSGLDIVNRLEPILFRSKADGDDPDKVYAGFGAEQVAAVFPEAAADENYDVRAIVAALVAAVQELAS